MSINALAAVNYELNGGRRRHLAFALVYLALIVFGAAISFRSVTPKEYGSVYNVWFAITSGVAALMLIVVAPFLIRGAVVRDVNAGMLESHRLTPISRTGFVVGYLLGATSQATVLYVLSAVASLYFLIRNANSLGVTPQTLLGGWIALQAGAACLALMAAGLFMLIAILSGGGKQNRAAWVAFAFATFGPGSFLFAFVPGLALVCGVSTIFAALGALLQFGGPNLTPPAGSTVLYSFLLQVSFGLIFLTAASRKFRKPDHAAFNVPLGLALLTLTGVALSLGMQELVRANQWFGDPVKADMATGMTFASLLVLMLVAELPLVAIAVNRFHLDRAAGLGQTGSFWQRSEALLVLLISTGLAVGTALAMVAFCGQLPRFSEQTLQLVQRVPSKQAALALAMLCSMVVDFNWMYAAVSRGKKMFVALILSIIILKVGPFLIDGAMQFNIEGSSVTTVRFGAASPIGTLLILCFGGEYLWPGLIAQAVIAAAFIVIGRRVRTQLRSRETYKRGNPNRLEALAAVNGPPQT